MIHEIYEFYLMAWHVAEIVLEVALGVSALIALGLLIHYTLWPEWKDSDPDPALARRLHQWTGSDFVPRPLADVSAEAWEQTEASLFMVEDACDRLHKDSVGQRFTANRGADHTAIFDISAAEHLRLLEQDPECYERD